MYTPRMIEQASRSTKPSVISLRKANLFGLCLSRVSLANKNEFTAKQFYKDAISTFRTSPPIT